MPISVAHCDSASKTDLQILMVRNAGYLLDCFSLLKCRRPNAVCLGIMSPRKLLIVFTLFLFNGGNLEGIS